MSLVPMNATTEVAVSSYLEQARDWLSRAVEETGPEQIAAAKAEIATAAEATKQLGLSKEIQLDAQEMVRRAEYALGKAIRKGQADGAIETLSDARSRAGRISSGQHPDDSAVSKRPLADFASRDDLIGNGAGIAHLADDVDPSDFDAALDAAKAEGNLSRANVVRKIKQQESPVTREARACDIAELAQEGHSTRQIAKKLGITEDAIYAIARDFDIFIPADAVVKGTRRLNSTRILSGAAESLEVAAMGLQQINPQELDQEAAQEWIDSLTASLTAIRKAVNTIKESIR